MSFFIIENVITNINFLFLFFTMLFYLLESAGFLPLKWSFLPNSSLLFSYFLQTTFLALRWFSSGHFPLTNLYESLLFLSWVLTSFLVFFKNKMENSTSSEKLRSTIKKNMEDSENLVKSFLASLLTPLILLINTFASFSLPSELKLTTSLVPALKSNWLMMHVTLMMLSYGALLCGCLLAMTFLIVNFLYCKPKKLNQSNNLTFEMPTNFIEKKSTFAFSNEKTETLLNQDPALLENKKDFIFTLKRGYNSYDELADILDNLSYRFLGLGFPLLTIGILSGAVWANQTWGSYWSWDIKETWAFITWLVFAIYLHTRISRGWSGEQSAFIACFGFIVIWIMYLGVNLLGKGLHSYGFFN
uniref:cytochrome c heme attachment protein n=1 Tax=Gayralia brasiliensis TaxID=1286870 RepID=UPI0024111CD6|nr:cytochrome c heme attachment protein [Gayralia brasiliensis]YP_010733755.1 cytochrome c heme attachment protein [Monostroma nitidum]WEG92952.1 cytochrome c heme attachment protein [Gayralia brasiliensis]WEG93026.1 cytochrome c heme attachment protein [Monostroma nitidum]